jgi:hypothetical protein
MVHWLCLGDSTYTELTGALPSQLAEQQEALDKVYNCSHVQIHTVQGQLHVLNKHDNKAVWYLSSCDSCLCLRRTRVTLNSTRSLLITFFLLLSVSLTWEAILAPEMSLILLIASLSTICRYACMSSGKFRVVQVKPGHTTCAPIGVSCHNCIVGHYHYRHAFTLWSECLVRLSCVLCHHIISIGMACRCWQR